MLQFNTSPEVQEIAKALNGFQKEIKQPVKNSEGVYNSKYADLGEVLNKALPILAKHGLSIMQFPVSDDTRNYLLTRLNHTSGQYFEGAYHLSPNKADIYGEGSAITYFRRYAISSILGLSANEDDDGQGAQRQPQTPQGNQQPAPAPRTNGNGNGHAKPRATAEQQKEFFQLINRLKIKGPDLNVFVKSRLKGEFIKITEMSPEQAETVLTPLRSQWKEQEKGAATEDAAFEEQNPV